MSKKNSLEYLESLPKKAMRDGYGAGLVRAGGVSKNVVALTADLKDPTRCGPFAEKYPKRFFEFGISEQNMMAAASGFAVVGKIPFVNSFAAFNPGRNWGQLRVSVCYSNMNVKIHGSHSGLTVGEDGATHQALEDIAITRVLPNMVVVVPCDYNEAVSAVVACAKHVGPCYIRTSRPKLPLLTSEKDKFVIGRANVLRSGKDLTIFACGVVVYEAMVAAAKLSEKGYSIEVINSSTIKPLDARSILKSVKKTGRVVSVEEHQVNGGLGSAVAELLVEKYPVKMKIMGVEDTFGESGPAEELIKKYGLDSNSIVKECLKLLKK